MWFFMKRNLPAVSALYAFEVVYRLQSISAAARELALTQGAVSKKIIALEGYLGRTLFERQSSGLRRTSAAEMLWARLPQCLDDLEEVMADVKSLASHGHVLNLAVCPTFATKWLMPRLPLFYDDNPAVLVNLRVQLDNVDSLDAGMDAGIAFGQPGWFGCFHYPIASEELLPICSPRYLDTHGPITRVHDLHRQTLLHQRTRSDHWERWFRLHGSHCYSQQKNMCFELFSLVVEATKAGLGVGLLPAIFIQEELRNGDLIALFDAVSVSTDAYYLICPQNKAAHPSLITFKNWITALTLESSALIQL